MLHGRRVSVTAERSRVVIPRGQTEEEVITGTVETETMPEVQPPPVPVVYNQAPRSIDLGFLCNQDSRFHPLHKYFERGVTLDVWDAVAADLIPTMDPCDRVLALQFKKHLADKFPKPSLYVLWVSPIPHDSLRPRDTVKIMGSLASGRIGYAFKTMDAAHRARTHMTNMGYTAHDPQLV